MVEQDFKPAIRSDSKQHVLNHYINAQNSQKSLSTKRHSQEKHEFSLEHSHKQGFPDSSVGRESACNAGNPGSIPGSGRSPGEGNGYPLQCSGLENSVDCVVHGFTKSWTQLSEFHFTLKALSGKLMTLSFPIFQTSLCLCDTFHIVSKLTFYWI